MFDTLVLVLENQLAAGQLERNLQSIGHAHESVRLALDQHVTGALPIQFFVADEGLGGEQLAHPISAQPTLQRVFAIRAVSAGLFDMRQIRHDALPQALQLNAPG